MSAEIGNKYAQKYTEEEAIPLFIKGLEHAEKSKECLSLADAIKHTTIPYSTYDYLAEKHNVLGRIKEDTKIEVTRRINKESLHGNFNATSAIWRMKQLGEKDSREVAQTVTNVAPLTSEELQKRKDDINDLI